MASVNAAEFSEFNRLLASAIERGVPVGDALVETAEQVDCALLSRGAAQAAVLARDGRPLHEAMEASPSAFPPEYCALVAAGVKGGKLAPMLQMVAAERALRARLGRGLRRILLYLIVGVVVAAGTLAALSVTAPSMRAFFEQMHMRDLPLLTEWALGLTEGSVGNAVVPIALVVLAAGLGWGAVYGIVRTPLVFWVPLLGRVQRARELTLSCSVLALQLGAGTVLPEAIAATARAARNSSFRGALRRLGERVAEGASLSEALFYDDLFPRTLAWAVSLGEQRSDVPGVLKTFGELYGTELERDYETLLVMLTPLSILVLGNIVFFYVMAMMLPLIEIQKRLAG